MAEDKNQELPYQDDYADFEGYLTGEQDVADEESEKPFSYFDLLDAPRYLPEPVDLTLDHLKAIAYELGLIKLCWPEITDPYFEDRTSFPKSYTQNSDKEKILLLYTENFRRQFAYKFPHRKPLFLACENECGMEKMVCTTIRPTTLPYPELETWEDCARCLADLVRYEVFEDYPTLLPHSLYSPHTTILRQSGHSFAMATALCSLLIGVGYDAFVVSGYAINDVTLRIMCRTECPFPEFKEEEEVVEEKSEDEKYKVRPPRDLRSKFLMMMAQKEIDKAKAEEQKAYEAERLRILEEEKRPPDELEGERVHAWVVILDGERKVDQPFFIEPSTGMSHPLDTDLYLGIESIWNHLNYWVNLQDCSEGIGKLEYNLKDLEKWEHILVGEPFAWRQYKAREFGEEEVEVRDMYDEQHLDMPLPWSMKISIPHELLKRRFPDGGKETYFKRTLVQEFAPYTLDDGLVKRITRFSDFFCTDTTIVEDYYENRSDKLYMSIYDNRTGTVTDYFNPGREDGAIKHVYCRHNDERESERTIFFNNKARFDSLSKIECGGSKLTEHYFDREDKLYFREVTYATDSKGKMVEKVSGRNPIHKIIQKFNRDESKKADDDIAVQEFDLVNRIINVKFQYGKNNVTASTRTFIKPPISEMGEGMKFKPELTYGYQADIRAKPPRQLTLYLLFEDQLKAEERVVNQIRDMETQISDFLLLRAHEMAFSKLDVSLYNKEQNAENRIAMLEREEELRQHKEKEVEKDIDWLAPYAARLGNPPKFSYSQALEAKYSCLEDFKKLLVARAQHIQKTFERMSEQLQTLQNWYTANHDNLNPEEEAAYFEDVNDRMFYLKTLEMRLTRHKDLAPLRYRQMEDFLNKHPQLKILQNSR